MRFVNILDLAEAISEEFDCIQFKRRNNKEYLLLPIENHGEIAVWLQNNKVSNVNLTFDEGKVKLFIS